MDRTEDYKPEPEQAPVSLRRPNRAERRHYDRARRHEVGRDRAALNELEMSKFKRRR